MNERNARLAVSVFALLFGTSSVSVAAIIDFTDGAVWGGADSQTTFSATDSGINAQLTTTLDLSMGAVSSPRNLTTNQSASEIAGCASAGSSLACGGDGIGIGDDEVSGISSGEVLTLSFESSPVNVSSITFLDLFKEKFSAGQPVGELAEFKFFDVSGVLITSSDALANQSPGTNGGFFEWVANEAVLGVKTIQFWAPDDGVTDFSLAAVDVAAVPIPAAAVLFGSALLGFFGMGRIRRKAT